MRILVLGGLCLALTGMCSGQQKLQTLKNDSIVQMVKAGLGEDVVLIMIQTHPGAYDITPDSLSSLKKDGVTDKVLSAMLGKNTPAPSPVVTPTAAVPGDLEIGVYYKAKDQWSAVATEPVNWKTGGVLKTIATDGIIKGDVNGRIRGAKSATRINSPLEFLIRTADGVEGTDYQLVHLHEKSDAREFRTLTGGVFHASGGASRDSVPFEQKKIARQTYIITLPPDLEPGEYAFLAAGLTNSTTSGSTGKAYTFRTLE